MRDSLNNFILLEVCTGNREDLPGFGTTIWMDLGKSLWGWLCRYKSKTALHLLEPCVTFYRWKVYTQENSGISISVWFMKDDHSSIPPKKTKKKQEQIFPRNVTTEMPSTVLPILGQRFRVFLFRDLCCVEFLGGPRCYLWRYFNIWRNHHDPIQLTKDWSPRKQLRIFLLQRIQGVRSIASVILLYPCRRKACTAAGAESCEKEPRGLA